ncbi:MAG TPA: TldD/PmbA family protein [Candidatus Hydrogenedentes bacterium]|nr:TldD/PmbA family protein [Candidatus Hydrogenedentota bacterium]
MDATALKAALHAAERAGASEAEVIATRSVTFDVEVAKGEVETLEVSESVGVGIRVLTADRRMGFAYSTDMAIGAESVAAAACRNATTATPDEHHVLPVAATISDDDWCEGDPARVATTDKVALARDLERLTLDADTRVTHVQDARCADVVYELTIANSRGMRRRYRTAYCSCSVVAAAAEDESDAERGYEFDFGRSFGALRLEWVARRAANDAVRCLGAKPCATKVMPVVLDNRVTAAFLRVIGPALRADSVLKGKSLFAGRLGEVIASGAVTLVDQNDAVLGMNRAPFDGEGTSAERTVLIDRGVLRSYLHDTYTARRMGTQTTANAVRGGFQSMPEVGATNCCIEAGGHALADLMSDASEGLYVTETMGVHLADPVSGDFSFGASGLMIEAGRPGRPVRGVTVAGNIKTWLQNIVAVGDDLRFFGAYGGPSLLISQLMVSGE